MNALSYILTDTEPTQFINLLLVRKWVSVKKTPNATEASGIWSRYRSRCQSLRMSPIDRGYDKKLFQSP